MSNFPKLGRRAFLRNQAAFIVVMGLPSLSAASSTNSAHAGKRRYAKAHWDTITAKQLSQFVGQRFSVRTERYGDIVMRLSSVDEVDSGPHRPRALGRREGVIATFESPDMEPLVRAGHGTHRVHHILLGDADLFMGPVPKRTGGHVLELVLN